MAEPQGPLPGMETISNEEWRYWMRTKIDYLEREMARIHQCIEDRHMDISTMMVDLGNRMKPLEQLRAMVLGAAVVVIAMAPLLWWVTTKLVAVAEKGIKP